VYGCANGKAQLQSASPSSSKSRPLERGTIDISTRTARQTLWCVSLCASAAHLRAVGWPEPVCGLVAHHSGSRFVAHARGLDDPMAEFEYQEDLLSDALTTADQTTGPHGRPMTVSERIDDMLARHGDDSPERSGPSRTPPLSSHRCPPSGGPARTRGSRQHGTPNFLSFFSKNNWMASVHQGFRQVEGRLNPALLASPAVQQGHANHR
jgi:hypothetical protein